jgi:hypothetical protein
MGKRQKFLVSNLALYVERPGCKRKVPNHEDIWGTGYIDAHIVDWDDWLVSRFGRCNPWGRNIGSSFLRDLVGSKDALDTVNNT